nr:hypothetical protein [Tanacetum cinerariifolium]
MSSETKLTKDEDNESVDNTKYPRMIGSLLYLTASRPDIKFSKKQTVLSLSTMEVEYVSSGFGKAFQQALWMKQALIDYDIKLNNIPVLCDNKGAIELINNHVLHSHTKHIEVARSLHQRRTDPSQKGSIRSGIPEAFSS